MPWKSVETEYEYEKTLRWELVPVFQEESRKVSKHGYSTKISVGRIVEPEIRIRVVRLPGGGFIAVPEDSDRIWTDYIKDRYLVQAVNAGLIEPELRILESMSPPEGTALQDCLDHYDDDIVEQFMDQY